MKQILLLLAAPFIFLTTLSAQITQETADNIVLERLNQETQPYIVYAKEGVQTEMTITTINGEELELDYPCWVYYASNISANCCVGSYLIVNESNGNLLEVKTKSDAKPSDLAAWKEKYNSLLNCNQNVIISAEEFENAPDRSVFIEDMKITDNCLKITYTTTVCDSRIWNLVDLGSVAESLPCQRYLRFSVAWQADYECAAAMPVTREMSFNIKDLQLQGYNSVILNIFEKSILYEYDLETIRHVKTVLGGCNNDDGLRSGNGDSQEDEVIVYTSIDSVRVFVGFNYYCAAPFETQCTIKNDTIRMYITDICQDPPSCYARCDCYYTFEFQFERKGDVDYQYIVELVSPIEGRSKILSEGKVEEETTPLTSTMWASVDNLPMGNLEFNRVYVINTGEELRQHPYFFQNGVAIPDITTKSIIVNYFSGCGFCEVKSAFSTENDYNWNIVYYAVPRECFRAESFITYMFVDKIPDNSTVTLNATVDKCTSEPMTNGNVLMLKVDYLTNTFEGGYEFTFDNVPNSFTIRREYISPGDFGYVKFFYYETGDMLFHGSIIWMGEGQIHFPKNLLPASVFDAVDMTDFVTPENGFENIMAEFQQNNIDYELIWGHVQNLVKVREYLKANPEQKVKIFLYTPCVGVGNPAHWDWILFLKK